MSFQIIRNDITKVEADAVVNTANPMPIYGNGVDQAIYMAAGEKNLLAERKKIGEIKPGNVAVTPAFNLPANYIIHTVGPIWEDGNHGELDILKDCYEKSLKKAQSLKCKSIAFPLIATGVYGFPKDKGLQIAMSVLQEYAMHHRMEIYLVIFDAESYELTGKVFDDIEAYIDDNYVDEAEKEYYEEIEEQLADERDARFRRRKRIDRELAFQRNNKSFGNASTPNEISLPEIFASVEEEDKTFQEKLFEYLDATGMKDSAFYKPLHFSKQMFSKIRGNIYYQPNRNTAIVFCIALKLDLDQTTDMLSRAGFAFNPANKVDMIIKSCIYNKQYNIQEIDLLLFKKGYPTLLKYE